MGIFFIYDLRQDAKEHLEQAADLAAQVIEEGGQSEKFIKPSRR